MSTNEKLIVSSIFLIPGFLCCAYLLFSILSTYSPELKGSELVDIFAPAFFTNIFLGFFAYLIYLTWSKK